MRSTRSFLMAAFGALALLLAVSASTYGHETASQPATVATQAQLPRSDGSSRLPFAAIGLGSLAAGAALLRRAPKLID